MIIDCHGHYTTAPKALEDWRSRQIAGIKDPSAMPMVNDPSDEGLKPASQSLTLGLHSFARLRAENISPVFARPGRSSLQRPE